MRLSGSETILAVDDDPTMLELVAEVLNPLGYKVILANSGEEALEIAASHQNKIDLLLTDVMLPGMKGQELAKQMIATCPEVSVLFMSGYLCPSMARSDREKGFEAFLQKPFTPSSMLRKMRKLLD
ncbi:MAG: response regulator [Deltaproteobacteria bacterium]|jgi:CheY-like chemotaxis protein|nr:response regulator [Deltaproteobacteria bacterium]MBW2485058.1 response regulator [Deltaproteobacteria bacterium]